MKSIMTKMTLLLLCMPSAMMVSLLSASATQIYEAYASYPETMVTMIVTIPSLSAILGLIGASVLSKRFPAKKIILAGMTLFVVSSVLPAWCENIYAMLFLRMLTGIGVGLVLPLQVTYFAAYPEKERATLMGLNTTVGCMVGAILVAISGVVVAVDWHYIFLLYLVNVIALIGAFFFLPNEIRSVETNESADAAASKQDNILQNKNNDKLKPDIRNYGLVLCFYYLMLAGGYLFGSILAAEGGSYLIYTGLGTTKEAGLVMSVSMIGSIIAGLVLQKYIALFKTKALPVIFMGYATGFLLFSQATSIVTVYAASFLLGASSGLIACVVTYELSCRVPLEVFTTAAAGVNFFLFALQFLSPLLFLQVLNFITAGSFRVVFLIYAVIEIMFVLISYFVPAFLLQKK